MNTIKLSDISTPLQLKDTLNGMLNAADVKVTQTLNTLEEGDTIFKGDTIKINAEGFIDFLREYTPKVTHFYLVDKDTGDGFRFDCYIRDITQLLIPRYSATVRICFLDGEDIRVYYSKTRTFYLSDYGEIETEYTFTNVTKDISNLHMYYTCSDSRLSGENHPGLPTLPDEPDTPVVNVQKITDPQDVLAITENGNITPIDNYVKVKLDSTTKEPDRLVQIVGNKEKEIPINKPVNDKIEALKDQISNAQVVPIERFIIDGFYWITETQLQEITPGEDKVNYIARKDDTLYCYTYNERISNVDFTIASSEFKPATIGRKSLYTATKKSYNREATALQLTKRPVDISAVKFRLYLQNLGVPGTYFLPEIAFINEKTHKSFEVQFGAWNGSFDLKVNSPGIAQQTLGADGQLPHTGRETGSSGNFDDTVIITLVNGTLNVYLQQYKKNYTFNLPANYPIRDFADVTNICFGVRTGEVGGKEQALPADWGGFSDVRFEKKYWEQSQELQANSLYLNLADNTLYRYDPYSDMQPYPHFISVSGGAGSTNSTTQTLNGVIYVSQGESYSYALIEEYMMDPNRDTFKEGKNYIVQVKGQLYSNPWSTMFPVLTLVVTNYDPAQYYHIKTLGRVRYATGGTSFYYDYATLTIENNQLVIELYSEYYFDVPNGFDEIMVKANIIEF